MSFESSRARFTHSVLDNGFFSYLSEPPAFWKTRSVSIETRASQLCQRWLEITSRPNSLRHAYRTWQGVNGPGASITAMTWRLYGLAQEDTLVRPAPAFPTRSVVSKWLEALQTLMDALNAAAFEYESCQVALVGPFWKAGIELYEFFQGTKVGSDLFWRYFESKS